MAVRAVCGELVRSGGLYVFFHYRPRWSWAIDDEYLASYQTQVVGYTPLASRSYTRLLAPHEETVTLHLRDSPEKSEPRGRGRCDRPL